MSADLILTCDRCGMGWTMRYRRGAVPRICPDCRSQRRTHASSYNKPEGYDLALTAVNLRLAVEIATAALELGRPAEALAALYAVEAPARVAARQHREAA